MTTANKNECYVFYPKPSRTYPKTCLEGTWFLVDKYSIPANLAATLFPGGADSDLDALLAKALNWYTRKVFDGESRYIDLVIELNDFIESRASVTEASSG